MVLFPNCKINLGLNIIRKREDGFHDLETVFFPIKIFDVLEVIQSTPNDPRSTINLSQSGLVVTKNPEDNICIKAYHLLKKDFSELPPAEMYLHKVIPAGAGLGGGSADGAFTLKLLNEKFRLNLSTGQLISYALRLGSDCPFFIINKPCFATGRGERLEEIKLDLSSYKIVIVNPGIHVNTGWAFNQVTPALPQKSIKEIIQQPILTWKNELVNDFEKPVFTAYPEIEKIKEQLYRAGAVYASMSGSGSTVYGIFGKTVQPALTFPSAYLQIEI